MSLISINNLTFGYEGSLENVFENYFPFEVKNKDGILVPDEEKLKEALKEHHENAVAYREERAAKRKGGG